MCSTRRFFFTTLWSRWVTSPACSVPAARSASSRSLFRFHISFFRHLSQSTTFTSANFAAPSSTYEKGSSRVLSDGRSSSVARSAQRVFPQVVSPAPDMTSDSVRHRRANCSVVCKRV